MTLDELIEELTAMRDDEGVSGQTEVRIAYQPNYPLYSEADTVTFISDDDDNVKSGELYIGTGGGNGYAPRAAFDGGVVYPSDKEE